MRRPAWGGQVLLLLIVAIVLLHLLASAGPTLTRLADAAVPLVVALGLVVALLRIVWHFTNRY